MARMRAPERRRQLLEVAARVFAHRGYRGATTAELAAEAGVTEPILYRHFESKLDLFVTLIDEVGTEVIAAWQRTLEPLDDPRDRLHALLAGNPATHARGRGVYRVIFQAMTELNGDRDIAEAIHRHLTRLHAFLRAEVGLLQESGVVRSDESPAALAALLINVAIGYGMVSPIGGSRAPFGGGRTRVQRLLEELLSP
jgi:AcrR family transcriptional regulator